MTAARRLPIVEPEVDDDPVWAAFLRAPVDPNPTPEHERLALADPSTQTFTDGATVTREIRARAQSEERPKQARGSRAR